MHLVIDGYGGGLEKLKDADLVRRFLDEYPATIGMTKMIAPQVYTYYGQTPEDWGVSGFVLIAESHISVHTFPDRGYVNIDIFSCKEFDVDLSVEYVKGLFSLSRLKVWTLERGIEYSTPEAARVGMLDERAGLIPVLQSRDVG